MTSPTINSAPGAAPVSPLVSVLVRSIGREAFLLQALRSVAAQTHPAIEIVVAAARAGHPPLPPSFGTVPVRLIDPGHDLARSQAANQLLDAARGEYLLFLDDDDWLMPGHVERLVQLLESQAIAEAAYTGVAAVDADGMPLGQDFDLPFDGVRMLAGNLTPIHSVLFSARLRDQGCRFDETLDRYEDWDFWLQVARRTVLLHLPGVSAIYRVHPSSGVHSDVGALGASSRRIYEKWQDAWSAQQLGQIMQRVWAYNQLEGRLAESERELHASRESAQQEWAQAALRFREQSGVLIVLQQEQARLAECLARVAVQLEEQLGVTTRQSQTIGELVQALAQRTEEAAHWQREFGSISNSTSWWVTRPLRWAGGLLRAMTGKR